MVRMRALKGFCRGAAGDVFPGDVFEADERQATEWAFLGFAERLGPVEESAPAERGGVS